MNKKLSPLLAFGIIIALAILTGGYVQFMKTNNNSVDLPGLKKPRACTTEAKLCSDGSAVGRSGPNCEFAECPKTESLCDYNDPKRSYVSKDPGVCATKDFGCPNSKTTYTKHFTDECGCGCEIID